MLFLKITLLSYFNLIFYLSLPLNHKEYTPNYLDYTSEQNAVNFMAITSVLFKLSAKKEEILECRPSKCPSPLCAL